ncbi:IclR family transcriptional regulator [Alkalimarinus alittae]|uniref:IclR family transcriptional regulator n=1 Tax=Alkalimarinus alittae TaxID=2961619 RepID=A0ABY6N2A7_9ALTE|nr:IclR family transcriptional regulator [Alkalimarinus alittae]UZE96139.1 IclR family transcriptional regulator [Alkalimarinus alittae]
MAKPEQDKQGGIQVIARAASILRSLAIQPKGKSLAEIAKEIDLPRSTVQRIVHALEMEGLTESVGPGGGFRIGPAVSRLVQHCQQDISDIVRPLLQQLSDDLQESVVLCHIEHQQVGVLERVVADQPLRVVFPVGCIRVPMHLTAAGKVLLAGLSPEERQQILPDNLPRNTCNSKDRATLLTELERVAKVGYAVDHEEFAEGIIGFAVRLDTYLGQFAVAVVVPSHRVDGEQRFVDALFDCKAQIERKISIKVG